MPTNSESRLIPSSVVFLNLCFAFSVVFPNATVSNVDLGGVKN